VRRIAIALVAVLVAAAAATVAAGSTHRASAARSTATVSLRSTKLGKVVVDAKGRTLYLFEKDKNGKSACYGACAKAWPPDITKSSRVTAGTGLNARLLRTTKRRDGTLQVSYGGHPLYRFIMDQNKPGRTTGEAVKAFGAEWYVVGANGKKIEKAGS
jgi:predicted lipoprotein with Yx(FWY)xxD motif